MVKRDEFVVMHELVYISACKWLHPMENKNEDSCKQVVREAAPRLIKQEYVVRVVASISKPTERIVPKPKTGSAKG
jgi:hypothetical protein